MSGLTAQIVVPDVEGVFSYRVPAVHSSQIAPGLRVLIPFGARRLTGFVVEVEQSANPRATKSIESLLDSEPAFSAHMLEFTRWLADYYLCPWGDVLRAALPAGIQLDDKRFWVASEHIPDALGFATLDESAQTLLHALQEQPLTSEQLRRRFGLDSSAPLLRRLRSSGIIDYRPLLKPALVKTKYDWTLTLSDSARAAYDSTLFAGLRSVHQQQLLREIHDYEPEGIGRAELLRGATATRRQALAKLVESGHILARRTEAIRWSDSQEVAPATIEPLNLTVAQQRAIQAIELAAGSTERKPLLLFGVTGSGKTQVYIEAIRRVLSAGKTALVLLPEIALTPFLWSRFRQALGQQVAIQHSAQSPAARYDLWREIKAGKFPVVIGARSALFAPLAKLGLIVIDEEHEASFKQAEGSPLYHARDAALVRARMEQAQVVLGSATPSLESYYLAKTGKYHLVELPERVGGAVTPAVNIVNWKPVLEEPPDDPALWKRRKKTEHKESVEPPLLTAELQHALTETLAAGRQAILLQNRRGYSPFLICRTCGYIPTCPNCSVSQTYHRKGGTLRCHYCDHRDAAPERCPRCGSAEWTHQGIGTQRIEDELVKEFPSARVLRMDSDTASGYGRHSRMVTSFAHHEYDILAGTQMIAKGLDFPEVDLAAVVRADADLFFPDFRASERGASLILQLAGRAGRRTRQGQVVIQSSVTNHPVIDAVMSGDWSRFADTELVQRERSAFPPYARLVLVRATAKDESVAARALLKLRRLILENERIEVLGPTPAVVLKVEQHFRYCLMARTRRSADPAGSLLRGAVSRAVRHFKESKAETGVKLTVDVDPQSSF